MTPAVSELRCRACLKQDELLVDIYEKVEEHQTNLCTLLERFGDIKVEESDAYPKYLCQECTKELLIAASFRDKCTATEKALKNRTLQRVEDEAAASAISILAGEELVVEDNEVYTVDAEDIIEFDPSEHVELYEECETEVPSASAAPTVEDAPETIPISSTYNCDDCGAVFRLAATLQRHLAKTHPAAETHSCPHCGHSFTQQNNLEKHKCAVAEAPCEGTRAPRALHRCIYCGKCVQSASSLVMHLRLHNGERPFACDVCPKTFRTNSGLVTHQKRHLKVVEFECKFCGKGFLESSNLRRHIASLHTSERPHMCTICQRSFSRVYLLELHKRTHTGERPYACSLCDRRFAQLSVLRTHERIHTGERRHRCGICQKTFSRPVQLKMHGLKCYLPTDTNAAQDVVS